MEISIRDYLKTLKGENILYSPNPGNGGDSVITSSTLQIFDKLQLNYRIYNSKQHKLDDSILIYGGGGNLVNPTSYSTRFISEKHKLAEKLIILPQTIKDVDLLLTEMGSSVDVICREPVSYKYAKSKAAHANVYLAHDMAIDLDVNQLIESNKFAKHPGPREYITNRYFYNQPTSSWTEFWRILHHKQRFELAEKKIVNGELSCFRVDGESNRSGNLPENNIDLSDIFTFGSMSRQSADFTTYKLLTFLKQCKTIHTDRLHIAISSALLGLEVNLFANNYYKIKEIYNYSIKNKFPNVIWHEK